MWRVRTGKTGRMGPAPGRADAAGARMQQTRLRTWVSERALCPIVSLFV